MCHVLLAAPVIGLLLFAVLPFSIAATLYALILIGAAALYILIWRTMRRPILIGAERLPLATGEIVEVDEACARARVENELWRVRSTEPLMVGDAVRVRAREGLTLVVEPLPDGPRQDVGRSSGPRG